MRLLEKPREVLINTLKRLPGTSHKIGCISPDWNGAPGVGGGSRQWSASGTMESGIDGGVAPNLPLY